MDSGIFRGMKLIGGTSLPPTPVVMNPTPKVDVEKAEKKPRGRPNLKNAKKQVRKTQMSALDMFIEGKPSKKDVREYFEGRIKALKSDD